jgi:serine/threonine-protein kinase
MYRHMLTGESPLRETKNRLQRMAKSRFTDTVPIQRVAPSLPEVVAARVAGAGGDSAAALHHAGSSPGSHDHQSKGTILCVESNVKLQDVLRDGLRREGYRVILISDPRRARERFARDSEMPEAVIFGAQDLERSALEAFNQFASDDQTHRVPAILLLTAKQQSWRDAALVGDHRCVLTLPLHFKEFREQLGRLLDAAPRR